MVYLLIFVLEIFTIYILSKQLSNTLQLLLIRIFNSQKASTYVLAFLYLPGTLIHEVAHYLVAVVLRVKATNFTLFPKIGTDNIILGSVGFIKPDPFRRLFIGIAPLLLGTFILLLLVHLFFKFQIPYFSYLSILFMYGLFTISSTMFSSKKDLEGGLIFLTILVLVIILIWIFKINLSPLFNYLTSLSFILKKTIKLLIIPLGIDLILFLVLRFINKIFS